MLNEIKGRAKQKTLLELSENQNFIRQFQRLTTDAEKILGRVCLAPLDQVFKLYRSRQAAKLTSVDAEGKGMEF